MAFIQTGDAPLPVSEEDEDEIHARKQNLIIADDVLTNPLTDEEQDEFASLANRFLSIPYCPWRPHAGPQTAFLLDFGMESLYGGAAGGGKSIALLMAASQFLKVPGYAALILRKSFADFNKPGALMDIAEQWWGPQLGHGVKFDRQNHKYIFDCPGGGHSSITFGYLDNESDRYNYQGGAYHFVGFDELTQFKERDYRYLFSRKRRVIDGPLSKIPTRFRSTTNPGGIGHEWVYKRFIAQWERWKKLVGKRPRRNFHPAVLSDNPSLDQEDYENSLMELDPVTRAQLLRGDWNIKPDGRMFKRKWFRPIQRDQLPGSGVIWIRGWDMAGTDPAVGLDPDYTVGTLVGRAPKSGNYYIADMRRWRKDPAGNDDACEKTVAYDTGRVMECMEQEPGSGGKIAIHHYRTGAFRTSRFKAVPSSGKSRGRTTTIAAGRKTPLPKILAAGPLSSKADAGLVYYVNDGSYDIDAMLSELEIFPDGEHDDIVDTLSLAVNELDKMPITEVNMTTNTDPAGGQRQANEWRPEAIGMWAETIPPELGGVKRGERVGREKVEQITPDMARADAQARASAIFSM